MCLLKRFVSCLLCLLCFICAIFLQLEAIEEGKRFVQKYSIKVPHRVSLRNHKYVAHVEQTASGFRVFVDQECKKSNEEKMKEDEESSGTDSDD